MENNNDLLERIRRSQQSVNIEEKIDNSVSTDTQELTIDGEAEQKVEPQGMFEKYAIAIHPFLVILLAFVLTLLRLIVFQSLKNADIIEMKVNSWGGYIAIGVGYITYSYLRDCTKKWRERKGNTKLSSFAIFVCYLGILWVFGELIRDLYYLIFG